MKTMKGSGMSMMETASRSHEVISSRVPPSWDRGSLAHMKNTTTRLRNTMDHSTAMEMITVLSLIFFARYQ